MWKTEGLKQALTQYGFDAAFGGARRDEEKSRAKERIFSFRSANHRWDPEEPAAGAVASVQRAQGQGREHPGVSALELDRARRVAVHPSREHPDRAAVFRRAASDGRSATDCCSWSMTSASRCVRASVPVERSIRFRTLGCYPLTGAIESTAATLPEIIREMLLATTFGAAGPRHRSRSGRLDGEEEAGGLFLMATPSLATSREARRRDIDAYLRRHQHKSLLRFITCGSVDDGKSTLIGRLLYDSKHDLRGPARGARGRQQADRHARASTSISRCWSTASPPSANRASPSTWPTGSSRPTGANSSSPTPRATSNTRATW